MASLSFGRSEALNNLGAKFGTLSLVYREFGQKLIHRLESNDGLQTSLVIDGPNGSGKSFTLRQILEHFKKNTEHFIVEIPSAADWVIGKYPYQRAGDKWEQPFLNTLFFKGLLEKNQIHADKFRIKEAYDLSTQKFQKETPISELLYFGSKNIDKSSEIVKLFFLECKKEKNVLVTVDKLNALYSYSCYFTEESKKIHSSDFLLSREILSLFHTPVYSLMFFSDFFFLVH
ncbi:37S ribosomal protein S23 mitochondrial [Coelomomyces lativittatus]|nr:37S ribosomal protein S23 mitochondrial [Coelomomyces lativittatus]KAJ1507967.1 37S ribosomal protein S23 mitochondrial [Coelomomyces lativittatus]